MMELYNEGIGVDSGMVGWDWSDSDGSGGSNYSKFVGVYNI